MRSIKNELEKFHDKDIYSMLLFALYKMTDNKEYSTLSELCYVLDKSNLLKLCEYFGGLTIHVPTVGELEKMLYALLLYLYVNIEGRDFQESISKIENEHLSLTEIKNCYFELVQILSEYQFTARG